MITPRLPRAPHPPRHQHGAALMVMLVILIMGAITIFVTSLNSSVLNISRDKVTADALAKAKEALIGYAASDNFPGDLPCPDVNDDGLLKMNEDYIGSNCVSPIGRLPWKTLGLPELRDSAGEHLWYAVSKNFWAMGTPSINSDTQGSFTITGTSPASGVIAIVFAPGAVLTGQDRSATQTACATTGSTIAANLCATNYLENNNASLSSVTTPNTTYVSMTLSTTFNDQIIAINHDQLFTPVEMRVAREVKKCLDDYAAADGNKYPWAAQSSDTTYYNGTYSTLFGRIPAAPNTSATNSDPNAQALSNGLAALLNAIQAFNLSQTPANQTALLNASAFLINNNMIPAIAGPIDNAGDSGKIFANNFSAANYTQAIADYNAAVSALQPYFGSPDASMPNTSWASIPACSVLTSSYWSNWKDEVFYQVADGFRPGSSASCGTSCLSVTGSGNPVAGSGSYRAAVVVARQIIAGSGQVRTTTANKQSDTNYLESDASGNNQHTTTPSTLFITYSPSDTANASAVNDLVLCVDGKVNCN